MKIKKKFNYATLCIVLLIGIIIGYSPNLITTKNFSRIHAPMGIEINMRLSYLDDAIHYELSVNDFDQKKIKKYKFPYTNRIPIGIIKDNLSNNHTITFILQDKPGIAVLYKKSISAQSFLSHYCGCTIFFKGRIEEREVTDLKKLWKHSNQFIVPSSFLYDRSIMFSEKLSF
ncbi:MAG: hypothetical protein CFH26_00125 [Alphaproteobacteria bacterium MarineAlpha6_Bin4]|nr:MAG: hypothetical protein CFH25_00589 [Alphaproteobacteria bacterium MarineAlpha6_Bin3]PPR38397.1 MAG: hypothetical protein CFH26_00125 [Alphaproteobacteria bacterium MarineAlpha6_Bin4]|tara:strand:- start:9815 stop:10333 length:519 start_codon:yes stop_codon:yes gene_type:complete